MTSPTPSPRKRGGQPGNINNLKHGFYSRALSERSQADLAGMTSLSPTDLAEEINVMRLAIRRNFELIETSTDPYLTASLLRAISFAASSLTRLVRLQHFVAASTPAEQVDLLTGMKEYTLRLLGFMKDGAFIPPELDPYTPDPPAVQPPDPIEPD